MGGGKSVLPYTYAKLIFIKTKHNLFKKLHLDLLFHSVMSLFTYAIELWGGASYTKYISQIDKFINRAF